MFLLLIAYCLPPSVLRIGVAWCDVGSRTVATEVVLVVVGIGRIRAAYEIVGGAAGEGEDCAFTVGVEGRSGGRAPALIRQPI